MVAGAFGPSLHRLKIGAFGPKIQLTVEPAKYLFYRESSTEESLNVGPCEPIQRRRGAIIRTLTEYPKKAKLAQEKSCSN